MENLYNFAVTICDISMNEEENKTYLGFIVATSYKEAAARIVENFGEEDIIELRIEYVTDSDIVMVPKEMFRELTKYNYC